MPMVPLLRHGSSILHIEEGSTSGASPAGSVSVSGSGSGIGADDDRVSYDNSKKQRPRGRFLVESSSISSSSFSVHVRSPREVLTSMYNDATMTMLLEFFASVSCFEFGVRGPTLFVLPLMGGMTMRDVPYQTTSAGDVLLDLSLTNEYVPKSDVVFPSERLWFISLWLPLSIVLLLGSFFPLAPSSRQQLASVDDNPPLPNMHAGSCAVLVSVGISEFVTQCAKFYVGRLRPNFYEMCGFDVSTLECTNGREMEMESRMSFPSGHSSLSFAGSVCLVLFFLGRIGLGKTYGGGGGGGGGWGGGGRGGGGGVAMASWSRRATFVASFSPLSLSLWCATSRLVDNWHHPSDILAGSIVGAVSAFVSYHIWFPHVVSVNSGIPLSVISSAILEDDGSGDAGMTYSIGEKSLSVSSFNVA